MTNLFGEQLVYASRVIEARRHPVDAGLGAADVADRVQLATQYTRVIMQVVVSLAVLAIGLLLLLRLDESTQKIGSSLIGLVAGYWLR